MKKNKGTKQISKSSIFVDDISKYIDVMLADLVATTVAHKGSRNKLPSEIADCIDEVLQNKKHKAYRDGLIIQIGWGLRVDGGFDHTRRDEGLRTVSDKLGPLLKKRHINSVVSAYQNIGKNHDFLARGNVQQFDRVLLWANEAPLNERQAAYEYILSAVALSARPVLPMPELLRAKLTFYECTRLIEEFLKMPSGGAYQQYAVAAFLSAVVDEFGQGGVGGLRIETKNINASDASSRVAGDVQIVRGNRVEEAFEVTANDWKTKIDVASAAAKGADLQRMHIIASVPADFIEDARDLAKVDVDLSVIDVSYFLRTLVAVMRKPAREDALRRLYELLDRHLTDAERTNDYVRLLRRNGLAAS